MTTLKVKEMSCNHCVGRIDTVLTEAGIAHSIQLDNKTVTIENASDVAKAIEEMDDIGFTAEEE
ncbi:heavy-metal-associated domain-containing protein [Anaerosporobacter sp.]|uniref:heavy-metal-associated domain-containing protein n=1 Tax=Anaerosporobacter sp. TaxID=1872529 RepID=UPI00286EC065|nr:heavy-metal-associated domain-containing protein [Anaerosporobacter sp.]